MRVLNFYRQVYRLHKHLAAPYATVAGYEGEIRWLEKYFREHRLAGEARELMLADLSDELLAAAMEHKLAKCDCAVPTANKLLRTIKAVWNFAASRTDAATGQKYLPTRPDLARLKEPTREPEAWNVDELARIVAAASRRVGRAHRKGKVGETPAGIWWPALILTVASTGVRISAVMAIESAKLDLARGEVFVSAESQKQAADQRFELKPEVVELLKQLRPQRMRCLFDDWPFDRTNPLSWPALEAHYAEILIAAGLPSTRTDKFHKLRKTFGTWIAAEAGEVVAQAMLGHSHISVTRRYLDKRQLKGPSARDLLPAIPLPAALAARPPENAA